MKKNKNRFLLGFFFGMLAMAVVVGGVGTGLYLQTRTHPEKQSVKKHHKSLII